MDVEWFGIQSRDDNEITKLINFETAVRRVGIDK